jgi:hypothetical protein
MRKWEERQEVYDHKVWLLEDAWRLNNILIFRLEEYDMEDISTH